MHPTDPSHRAAIAKPDDGMAHARAERGALAVTDDAAPDDESDAKADGLSV